MKDKLACSGKNEGSFKVHEMVHDFSKSLAKCTHLFCGAHKVYSFFVVHACNKSLKKGTRKIVYQNLLLGSSISTENGLYCRWVNRSCTLVEVFSYKTAWKNSCRESYVQKSVMENTRLKRRTEIFLIKCCYSWLWTDNLFLRCSRN